MWSPTLLNAHPCLSSRIIYRDLKPTNIGFDVRGHVKVFDLGLAKELKDRDLVDGDKYDLTPMTGTRVSPATFVDGREYPRIVIRSLACYCAL